MTATIIRVITGINRGILFTFLLAVSARPADAVEVKGKIELSPPPQKPKVSAYPGKVVKPGRSLKNYTDRTATVFLVPLDGEHSGLVPQRFKMDQLDLSFEPHVLAIPVGSTVDFYNLDPLFHNVFSFSKPKKFDLGRYPKGEYKSVKFDQPGLIKVFCEIHSEMKAYILVLKTPYLAYPDQEGDFVFANIPPGKYLLRVWQEAGPSYQAEITVPKGDAFNLLDSELAPVADAKSLFE